MFNPKTTIPQTLSLLVSLWAIISVVPSYCLTSEPARKSHLSIDNVRDSENKSHSAKSRQNFCELEFFMTPSDMTVSCQNLPVTSQPIVNHIGSDCCEPITVIESVDTIPGTCPIKFTLKRTWTASDECGNTATTHQFVQVVDITSPVFVTLPNNITINCDSNLPDPVIGIDVVATDNCNTVTISASKVIVPGVCQHEYIILYTYVATDRCNNSSMMQRTRYVRDISAPVFIDPPQNITIHCHAPVPPVDTLEANDNCSDQVWFTFTEGLTGGSYCDIQIRTRTWTAEDMCGNRSTHTQTITKLDAGPPSFAPFPDTIYESCGKISPFTPNVSDDCAITVQVNESSSIIPGNCPGNYVLIRTWTAVDDCGFSSTASQVVNVIDTIPPSITFDHPLLKSLNNGDTLKISCNENVIFGLADATIKDDCDNSPAKIFIDSLIYENNCIKLLYCEWAATDNCGNTTSFIFYMLVGDYAPPVITGVPADLTISCNTPIPPPANPILEDECDLGPKLYFNQTTTLGNCPNNYKITRIWEAVDFCGNISTAMQMITVQDLQAPVMNGMHPLLVGKPNGSTINMTCPNETIFKVEDVLAIDNCDLVSTVTLAISTLNVDCITNGHYIKKTYVWTASDDCGNHSTLTIHVNISDNSGPIWVAFPADATISCTDPIPNTKPVASDNCSGLDTLTSTDIIEIQQCGRKITRTWTAIDKCGNSTTRNQIITESDFAPPVISGIQQDLTVACDQSIPDPVQPNVNDNCDQDPKLSLKESVIPGNCPGNYTIKRIWTAVDKCNNTSTAEQTITVIDTVAPIFIAFPSDGTVACDELDQIGESISAVDNCNPNPIISIVDQKLNLVCEGEYFLISVYTADDQCGNSTSKTLKLYVYDDEAPTFINFIPEITISCENAHQIPKPVVSDNCDANPEVTYVELDKIEGSCSGEYQLIILWTVSDHCGNTATQTQSVVVNDYHAPIIEPIDPIINGVPSGTILTFECPDIPLMDVTSVLATDHCSNNITVTFEEEVQLANCDIDGYLFLLRCTWKAVDDCGNESSYTVFIKAVDTKAPVFIESFNDITIDLQNGDTIPAAITPHAVDACDENVTITLGEATTPHDCGYLLIRTWTAVDECGNTATEQQVIYVKVNCPCQEPEIKEIHQLNPKCYYADGEIVISTIQNPDNYTFTWIPDLGVPGNKNNIRTALPNGTYEVYVSDPSVQGTCFTKVSVTLNGNASCIDTVYISIPSTVTHTECISHLIDFPNLPVNANICELDHNKINAVAFKPTISCLQIEPVFETEGVTTICVIHCDDIQPSNCDTTILIVTLTSTIPCNKVFTENTWVVEDDDCEGGITVCLPIEGNIGSDFSLNVNGNVWTQPIEGCNFKTITSYNLAIVPGMGLNENYVVESWNINGLNYTTQFNNQSELINWMNMVDPLGYWSITQNVISGGRAGSSYFLLRIKHVASNVIVELGPQVLKTPLSYQLSLSPGTYNIVSYQNNYVCQDSLYLYVDCNKEENRLIAVNDTIITKVNKLITRNVIANDKIAQGPIKEFLITQYPVNGSVHVLNNTDIVYKPIDQYCGLDSLTYVVCDQTGCDDAVVYIEITCAKLIIFTGVSPNNDGINDAFFIEGIEDYPNNTLSIYNRWGNLIYHTTGYLNTWKGNWEGNQLPDGTYFYVLNDGEGGNYSGYLQIQR